MQITVDDHKLTQASALVTAAVLDALYLLEHTNTAT